ncbi:mechanosensitive ion channel domain-containing protein [Brucella sp. BE17]|uniref:mechanosensitive ion channel family protein n=1 Tax=Brucella sp. BE17 TaxID=3142977 RepID=UPI0031BABE2B
MKTLEDFLISYPWIYTPLALLLLLMAAVIANFIVKRILLRLINRFLGRTVYGRDEEIRRHGVIERLANITPALVIASGIVLVPHLPEAAVTVVRNVANASIILTLAMALSAVLNVVDTIYHRRPEARLKPIRSYIQIVKIAVYVIAAILMVATLVDQSPLILLSGLGAMAAVLILVFQDTLLSLVAGIQISSTDMIRMGDWIEMPALNADGDVIEIALHTVRVQNFDKTITTIPIRKLVTESFKNYRGMQESGGRRIKRSIYLDQTSIRFLTQEEIDRLSRFRLLENYLQQKQDEIREWNEKLGESGVISANTRRITNVGTFRAYVEAYLRNHSQIHQNMTLIARQLQPGPDGLPVEVYCFSKTTVWASYEAIQSDIFDHLFALLPEFGLALFQNPSGRDFKYAFAAPRRA